jgi:hypothetical protein
MQSKGPWAALGTMVGAALISVSGVAQGQLESASADAGPDMAQPSIVADAGQSTITDAGQPAEEPDGGPISLDGGAPSIGEVKAPVAPAPATFTLPSYLAWTEWVRIYGFAQIDYLFSQASQNQLDPTTGQPLNLNRIFVRRARLGADLERTYVAGNIEFDGNTVVVPTVRLIDAEASIKLPGPTPEDPPLIMGTIGLMKIPFGYEIGQRDVDRLFMERSTMEHAFFPGEYDLGIRLRGGWRFLRYAVALMNGEPIGESSYPGIDPNANKDIVGRLGVVTKPTKSLHVEGGVSFLSGTGFHPGTSVTKSVLYWQNLTFSGQYQNGQTAAVPGSASTPSQNFNRYALGGDLLLAYDELPGWTSTIYGEIISATNLDRAYTPADPIAASHDLRELGYYVAVTQLFLTYGEVGARYSYYNPNQDATYSLIGQPVPLDASDTTWSLTAAAVSKYARFIAEVDINQNHLGRSPTGAPANLASNAFIIRGEVKF